MSYSQLQILIVLGVILGVLVLGGLITLICYLFSLRHYVLVVRPGKRMFINRKWFWPSGDVFTWKGKEYMFTDKCMGSISGRKAIMINPDVPSALVWADFDKNFKWDFLSVDTITAIINDEHVKTVANAGQERLSAMQIVLLIGLGIILIVLMVIGAKLFGAIKPPITAQCIGNITQMPLVK